MGKHNFIYRGVEYRSKKECCLAFGLKSRTIAAYSRSHDMSFESALDLHISIDVDMYSNAEFLYGNTYVYRGVMYKSKKDCCLAFGLKFKTVSSYAYSHDISFETALDKHIDGEIVQGEIGYTYRGVEYKSKKDCCSAFGLQYSTVTAYRYRHNITFECALDKYVDNKVDFRAKAIELNGNVYNFIKDCCEDLEISYDVLKRFKNHNNLDSISDAINVYLNHDNNLYNGKSICIDGVYYSSVHECCNALGLCNSSVYTIMRRSNCDAQTAISYLKKHRVKAIEYNGVVYKSMRDCCKQLDLDYDRIKGYMKRNNCEFDFAVDYILAHDKKDICIDGMCYKSLSDCLRDMNLSYSTVRSVFISGKFDTIEEAVCSLRQRKQDGLLNSNVKYKVSILDKSYESLGSCCSDLGISKSAFTAFKSNMKIDSVLEALKYYIIFHNFSEFGLRHRSIIGSDTFICRCNKCGNRFLFTRDLAFKHIEECYGK